MKTIYTIQTVATILLLIILVSAHMFFDQRFQDPTVTAAEIQALQADSKSSERLLILDVRDKTETDVSIIPGAITLADFEKTRQNHTGKTVITYCTVGYRSGIYAQKLRKNGWQAWNYQGSILDWCNNRLPVETPIGQSTTRVHTYSSSYELAAGYQPVY